MSYSNLRPSSKYLENQLYFESDVPDESNESASTMFTVKPSSMSSSSLPFDALFVLGRLNAMHVDCLGDILRFPEFFDKEDASVVFETQPGKPLLRLNRDNLESLRRELEGHHLYEATPRCSTVINGSYLSIAESIQYENLKSSLFRSSRTHAEWQPPHAYSSGSSILDKLHHRPEGQLPHAYSTGSAVLAKFRHTYTQSTENLAEALLDKPVGRPCAKSPSVRRRNYYQAQLVEIEESSGTPVSNPPFIFCSRNFSLLFSVFRHEFGQKRQ